MALFVTACVIGGLGGFAGSVVGGAFGKPSLFAGGFVGGVLVAPITAWIARRRKWISMTAFWPTAAGAAIGFLAAATVAVNTLSSPIGPVLSTVLIGLGAVAGSRIRLA